MSNSLQLSQWPVIRPIVQAVERNFPILSYRLTAALRVTSWSERSDKPGISEWWARVITTGVGLFISCLILTYLLRDGVWLGLGIVGLIGYPVIRYRTAVQELTRYQRLIAYELPEFVQILAIYLYAGFTASSAMLSTAERWKHHTGPLSILVQQAAGRLTYQAPLHQVLHRMSARADTHDMKTIVNLLLTHTTRGGDATIETLLDISRQMWSKRLSLVRQEAEETTVKMIFPLMLIFIAVLLIVGAPAVMFIQS